MRLYPLLIFLFTLQSKTFSQSLKDSLYGGKIKAENNKVVMSSSFDTCGLTVVDLELYSHVGLLDSVTKAMPDDSSKWEKYIYKYFIQENDKFRDIAVGEYVVLIEFEVQKDGKLGQFKIVRNPGYKLGQQLVEIISTYPGRWKPATYRSCPILSFQLQPVIFKILATGDQERSFAQRKFRGAILPYDQIPYDEIFLKKSDTILTVNNESFLCTINHTRKDEDIIFEKAETKPFFPGGDMAWEKWVKQNIHDDEQTRLKNAKGSVWVQFVVTRTGETKNFKLLSKNTDGSGEEAIRLVKKSGKWFPAKYNGICVNAYVKVLVTFE